MPSGRSPALDAPSSGPAELTGALDAAKRSAGAGQHQPRAAFRPGAGRECRVTEAARALAVCTSPPEVQLALLLNTWLCPLSPQCPPPALLGPNFGCCQDEAQLGAEGAWRKWLGTAGAAEPPEVTTTPGLHRTRKAPFPLIYSCESFASPCSKVLATGDCCRQKRALVWGRPSTCTASRPHELSIFLRASTFPGQVGPTPSPFNLWTWAHHFPAVTTLQTGRC